MSFLLSSPNGSCILSPFFYCCISFRFFFLSSLSYFYHKECESSILMFEIFLYYLKKGINRQFSRVANNVTPIRDNVRQIVLNSLLISIKIFSYSIIPVQIVIITFTVFEKSFISCHKPQFNSTCKWYVLEYLMYQYLLITIYINKNLI